MSFAVLLSLLLQADPEIRSVERVAGDVHRPYHWTPLRIEVASAKGFEGDLEIASTLGFTVRRRIRIAPGGRDRFLVPSIDPERVSAGGTERPIPAPRRRAAAVVGVDERLKFASELSASGGVSYRILPAGDLEALVEDDGGEVFELILLSEGVDPGMRGRVVATKEEAERAVSALGGASESPRVGVLDRALWELQPRGGWIPAKRNFAVFFVTIYVLAAFAALAGVARKRPRWAPGVLAGVAVLGAAAYLLFFPSGRLRVVVSACEVAREEGRAAEWRVWFVGADADVTTEVELPRLAKPVLQNPFADPFAIRVLDRGCRIEELTLKSGRTVCFAGGAAVAPSLRVFPKLSEPLYRAGIRRPGGDLVLGDLEREAVLPADGGPGRTTVFNPDLRAFEPFLAEPCFYGWLDRGDGADSGVVSPDLDVAARLRPRLFIAAIP